MNIPVFCITGASGTGKTTLLVQLLQILQKRGIRTAVFKHDAHDTDWDQKGKDSQKLTEAGATVTGLLSVSRTMRIENRSTSLQEMIRETKNVDLVLLEGFHDCPYPKIQVYRAAVRKQLRVPPEQCAAMVTDTPFDACPKNFRWEEVDALAKWMIEHCQAVDRVAGKNGRTRYALSAERQKRISVEEAQARILQLREREDIRNKREAAVECLPVYRCQGRILAESVYAKAGHPRFHQSAMDGYALRSEETRNASAEHPVTFRVIGMITAGEGKIPDCGVGEAARIMTGGKVPDGADCVIRQEAVQVCETSEELGEIQVSYPIKTGDCICRQEEDFRTGEQILVEGDVLDAGALGLASSAGIRNLTVQKKLRAAIMITGSEVIRAGHEPGESQIFDAMESYLYARMEQLQMFPEVCRIVPDEPEQLQTVLEELSESADVIVTTGGVSVGVHDYMPRVIEDMHGEILFHGIAMKPGMPTMLSVVGGVPMLSLSGNPSAAAVAFELFMPYVQEAMRRCCMIRNAGSENAIMGHEAMLHQTAQVTLATDFEKSSPIRRFLWGYSDGRQVWAAEHQRNGNIRSLVGQNCLIDIPAGSEPLTAGESVMIRYIKNVSIS